MVTLFPGTRSSTPLVKSHPELLSVVRAVKKRDTTALLAAFQEATADADPTWAVNAVSEVKGAERHLERMVQTQPESLVPQTMLGARYVVLGWRIRSNQLASYVSSEQFQVFHQYLRKAEQVLSDVASAEPGNVAAWTWRLTTARGLQFGLDEARRRYAMAAAAYPNPLMAQRSLIQQLCPKWGGTFAEVHQFARECMVAAPEGSPTGALVAEGHIEHMFTAKRPAAYLREAQVRRELEEAEERSVGHPSFQAGYGSRWAHSVFAFVWHAIGDQRRAATHFRVLGRRAGTYPWGNYPDGSYYRRARRTALAG